MTSKTRYGLIGCGMMGQEHLRNINLLPDTQVTAIFEPDPGMRAEAAQLAPEARFFPSAEELLAFPDLDCLVIVSPNFRHVEQLVQIAEQRPLPILVEKPLLTDPEDFPRIRKLQATFPHPIWVAMEYRYMPPVAYLLQEAAGVTGGIRMLTIQEHRFPFLEKVGDWNRFNRYSGGTLVEKCCHFFDLMRFALQDEPIRVMASGGQANNHLEEQYAGETPDIWDHAYVIVEFAKGGRALLELCMFAEGARYQEEISALGPQGKLECLVPGPQRFWPESLGEPPVPQVVVSPRSPKGPRQFEVPVDPKILEAGDHNGSTFYQHEKFLAVVRGQGTVEVSVEDGLLAVAMGMAAQESAATGKTVELQEFLNRYGALTS